MKLAYVTTYDSSDIHVWSGTANHMLRALQDRGFQTELIGNLKDKYAFMFKIKKDLYAKILSKTYFEDLEPFQLKNYANQVERALAHMSCDVVFSPGTLPIAYLQTEKPIVFWADATFAGMVGFYPCFSNFRAKTIENGNKIEQLALSKCRLAIYSSEWAANTAIQNYAVDPEKVKVVPFGANIKCTRKVEDIYSMSKSKKFDVCKLLFIGVDWFRKGGDVALRVAELLIQRGIRTELHIVGCNAAINLPAFVKQHGFLSKIAEEGRMSLEQLMAESHFLILPSKAECCAVVLAEASSFGLPSLTTNVGGIPTAIKDGKNGQTFPLNEDPEKYCDYIERFMSSEQEYRELALSSFREYSERLNWSSAGRKVDNLIQEFCV